MLHAQFHFCAVVSRRRGGGQIWECSNESSAFLEIGSIGVKNVLAECFLLGETDLILSGEEEGECFM